MKPPDRETGQPNAHPAEAAWQLLGELELPVGAEVQAAILAWLSSSLAPLHLPADLLDRVLRSAEEAAVRALQTETARKHQHSHLLVFIPASRPEPVETWGFFRIEKMQPAPEAGAGRDHSLEFYLYVEGQ